MVLADISIKRPVLMTMLIFVFIVIGFFSLSRLGVDMFPKIDLPFVTVMTIYPGAGPEEIETLINEKLEEEISSVSGIKNLNSISQEGLSYIIIEFELGVDANVGANDVKDKIDGIRMDLPDDIEEPVVQKFEVGGEAVISLSVSGNIPLGDIYKVVDEQIKPELSRINGVANIDVIGEKEREIQVYLTAHQLESYGLTPFDVVQAIASENLKLPAGRINRRRSELTLRMDGEYSSIDEIAHLQIETNSGSVSLDRIATVSDDYAEQREKARFNSRETIGIDVVKQSDANVIEVADRVLAKVSILQKQLPDGVKIEVATDKSQFIRDSVADVSSNLVLGILFTSLVLFIFLHNWKGTIIAAVSMPISIISTFTLLLAAGFTLNIMSLMGLSISVGILVVNAIVVLENIERYRQKGFSAREAASKGTSEIAIAVAASTLTNVVVFTPMAFLQGIIGPIFQQFGLTVAFATIFSLLVSFTLTPMMSSRQMSKTFYGAVAVIGTLVIYYFLGPVTTGITAAVVIFMVISERLGWVKKFGKSWDQGITNLEDDYRNLLKWSINHRWVINIIIIAMFFGALTLFRFIGSEFFPNADERSLSISFEMPAGTSLDETDKVAAKIESVLESYPDVENYYTSLGKNSQGSMGNNTGVQYGQILVNLKDFELGDFISTRDFIKQLRPTLADIPAATIVIQEASQMGGSGNSADFQLEVQGDNMEDMLTAVTTIEEVLDKSGKLVDINSDWQTGKPEIIIRPNRERMSDRGVNVQTIAMTLRTLYEGSVSTKYREEGEEYDVRVRFEDADKNRADLISDLKIPTESGFIPLKDLTTIEYGDGPTMITRKNKKRLITVSANLAYGTIGQAQGDLEQALQLEARPTSAVINDLITGISTIAPRPSPLLPEGITVHFGGQAEMMADSFTSLLQALLLAVILTYMLLAAILEHYRFPAIIMTTIPLGLIGVAIALVMTGKSISMIAMMAFVMLVGIVVNNGILLIDYVQQLRKMGKSVEGAILEACPARLRPILMSNIATVLGMLPLALGIGSGGEIRAPMAIVAIGGVVSSTIITLFSIPVSYAIIEFQREKKASKTKLEADK